MYYTSDFHFTCHNIFKYKPKRNNSSQKHQLSTYAHITELNCIKYAQHINNDIRYNTMS